MFEGLNSEYFVPYDGDESAVLLPVSTKEQALVIAERVRVAVSGSNNDSSNSLITIPVKASLGLAELTEDGTLDTLRRAADAALYRAKGAGRDLVSD